VQINLFKGENTLDSWAKIIDCGDVPMTYLDNTIALKQLGVGHKVGIPALADFINMY
jgi:agmatinase